VTIGAALGPRQSRPRLLHPVPRSPRSGPFISQKIMTFELAHEKIRCCGDQRQACHVLKFIGVRPVSSIHRVEAHTSVAHMDLQAITIMLQLMRPPGPARRLAGDCRLTGIDETGRRINWPASKVRDTMRLI